MNVDVPFTVAEPRSPSRSAAFANEGPVESTRTARQEQVGQGADLPFLGKCGELTCGTTEREQVDSLLWLATSTGVNVWPLVRLVTVTANCCPSDVASLSWPRTMSRH